MRAQGELRQERTPLGDDVPNMARRRRKRRSMTMIRDRLLQIRDLLAPDGSVWLHLDDAEMHRARSVMDEIFGPDQFVATVIWEKADSPRMDAQYFSGRHDYLLVYRRTEAFAINRFAADVAHTERHLAYLDVCRNAH